MLLLIGQYPNQDILQLNETLIYIDCFDDVQRSLICYAKQVWGYKQYDQGEQLLRLIDKRVFQLLDNTPPLFLHL